MEKLTTKQKEVITLKDTIVFCRSWHESWRKYLTAEQYVAVMDVIMNYYASGCVLQETGDALVDLAAQSCKHTLDENLKSYLSGKKGGRPKKESGDATA